MSQFFTSGGQSIGVSASTSVLPMNVQDWFPVGWTGWISLKSKGLWRVFNTTIQSINSLALSFLYGLTLTSIHDYWKTIALTRQAPKSELPHYALQACCSYAYVVISVSFCSHTPERVYPLTTLLLAHSWHNFQWSHIPFRLWSRILELKEKRMIIQI